MTEGASLALIGGGSITGFNQAMETGVPEPRTWAMMGLGFGLMAFMGYKRSRKTRFAF
jgi:Zn-dependent alcohol dehydrogenase